jgi:molecular chaperone GrpE
MDPTDRFRRPPVRPHVRAVHRTRADERAEAIDTSPAALAREIERLTRERDAAIRRVRELEAQQAAATRGARGAAGNGSAAGGETGGNPAGDPAALEAALKARDEFLAALQRERAEFLNFKRRTAEEREASLGLAAEGLITKVLALADDFDRAIESRPAGIADDPWVEGIEAIDRKLRQLLESEGVSPIDAAPGTPFDPRDHEAVANVPNTGLPEGHVVEELRRGYRLRDRVIRPALVAVSQGGAETGDATSTTESHIH